jgi:hypothetical protein
MYSDMHKNMAILLQISASRSRQSSKKFRTSRPTGVARCGGVNVKYRISQFSVCPYWFESNKSKQVSAPRCRARFGLSLVNLITLGCSSEAWLRSQLRPLHGLCFRTSGILIDLCKPFLNFFKYSQAVGTDRECCRNFIQRRLSHLHSERLIRIIGNRSRQTCLDFEFLLHLYF